LLLSVLTFGIFLRFHQLSRQSLWNDEMYSLSTARAPLSELKNNVANDGHPPVHALQLIACERLFGDSVGRLRANSALWGSLTLVLLALLVVRTGGDLFCVFLTVGLFGLSPLAIGYAQELRPYALSAALVCGCALILAGFLKSGSTRGGTAWFAVVGVATCLSHYWAAFSVFALLFGAWIGSKDSATRRRLVGVAALCLFVLVCWLPVLVHQISATSATNAFWMSPPGFKNLALTFLAYTEVYFRFASNTFVLTHNLVLAGAVGACYAVALGMGLWKGPSLIRYWFALGIATPFVLSFWKPHLYVAYRYPFIVYPAFVLTTAYGLQAIRLTAVRWGLALVLLVSSAAGTKIYFSSWEKANPKSVAEYVARRASPDTVIVRPAYFSKLFGYYYRGSGRITDENTLDSPAARLDISNRPTIFLSFDVPSDPVGDALIRARVILSRRYFPGHSRLGITVYELGQKI
jgi:uncharacterized membrane protein